jgi:hypothetical protein
MEHVSNPNTFNVLFLLSFLASVAVVFVRFG